MKPDPQKARLLIVNLKQRLGSRFEDLQRKSKEFGRGLKSLPMFQLVEASEPSKHVGRVIVGGVLQQGKSYEKQVRPAVNRISHEDQAVTISGFIGLLENNPLDKIINFKTGNTKNNLLSVALFFQQRGVDTFDELYNWLEPEKNRDNLLSKNSGLKGRVFSVADKTADYFRKLVGHWDAVAVDRGIKERLAETKVLPRYSTRYSYKEKRAVVQMAALELGCRPRDLDSSLYR